MGLEPLWTGGSRVAAMKGRRLRTSEEMGQVTITVNGRTYRLECGEGEEGHLLALADRISREVDDLRTQFGQIGDERLLLMAGLAIADELWETRRRLSDLEAQLADRQRPEAGALNLDDLGRTEIADQIDAVADRIEALSLQLAGGGSSEPGDGGT